MARRSKYTQDLGDAICERISAGESVRAICQTEGMPNRQTVLNWLASNPDFSAKCARAWDLQADALADQQLEVASGVLVGTIDPQAGKVAISTYQWLSSKRAPKRYGDRLELAGDKDNPIKTDSTLTVRLVGPERIEQK